jgi:hypothetical protein
LMTRKGEWQDDDQAKMIDELKKRNDLQRMEAERLERQRDLIKQKIAANMKEREEKQNKEIDSLIVETVPVPIEAEIKVRVYVPEDGSEIDLGFGREATVKDLYEKIASKLERSDFSIKRFAHQTTVPASRNLIFEEFKAKALMIEISSNK